jgi:hypothetical protein
MIEGNGKKEMNLNDLEIERDIENQENRSRISNIID